MLATSQHPQLLYLSLSSFSNLLPIVWRDLSTNEKMLLIDNIFAMLMITNEINGYLIGGLAKALARIIRLGWTEIESIKEVTFHIESIIDKNISKLESGLKFFKELIIEINEPVKYRTISMNKKIAISFKEEMLGNIFNYGLQALSKAQTINKSELKLVLDVINLCISFDFYEDTLDDSFDDSAGLQIPSSWKYHFETPVFLEHLKIILINSTEEIELSALRVLNSLGVIRKGVFSASLITKRNYIDSYLLTIKDILYRKSLNSESLFELMNALKRFFVNFDLKEVSEASNFQSWLEIFKNYSIMLFSHEKSIFSSIESSMYVWSYLSYESHIQLIPSISIYIESLFEPFITMTLLNVRNDILIENIEGIKEHIDIISNFSLHYYFNLMNSLQRKYLDVIQSYENTGDINTQAKLAWLIMIASGFVSLRDSINNSDSKLDISMTQLVFTLINKIENKIECLCLGILFYLNSFSKAFINSSSDDLWNSSDLNTTSEDTLKQAVSIIIEIIFHNLSSSSKSYLSIYSLELFEYLCTGYYSNKILIKVNIIQNFMVNYTSYHLCLYSLKLRYRLFKALANLWINDEMTQSVDTLLYAFSQNINAYSQTNNPKFYSFFYRELQGIFSTITSQKHYLIYFEWFIEKNSILMHCFNYYINEDDVMSSMLKFLAEITNSRSSRIKFNDSSAHGILFFKYVSEVIIGYGNYIGINSSVKNISAKIRRIVNIMINFINGGYICFGVFEVYNDKCFFDSLKITYNLIDPALLHVTNVIDYLDSCKTVR